MPYYKSILFVSLTVYSLLFFVSSSNLIHAQTESIEVTEIYTVNDPEASDHDILFSTVDRGIVRSNIPYDNRIFGVLQKSPVMVLRREDNLGEPVARTGVALVNVTTLNGNIVPGDYITSSEITGKGQKAGESGYTLGIAMTGFNESTGEALNYQTVTGENRAIRSGTISVALRIEFTELSSPRSVLRTLDFVNSALLKNVNEPDQLLQLSRFLGAAIIILVSLMVGFLAFSRSIPKSIEAIGRNPLAEKSIRFSITIHFVLTILIAGIGLLAAYIIIKI